jgi:hypothetical protein
MTDAPCEWLAVLAFRDPETPPETPFATEKTVIDATMTVRVTVTPGTRTRDIADRFFGMSHPDYPWLRCASITLPGLPGGTDG